MFCQGSWDGRPPWTILTPAQQRPHRGTGSPCPGHSRRPAEKKRALVSGPTPQRDLSSKDKTNACSLHHSVANDTQGEEELNACIMGKPVLGLALCPCVSWASHSTSLNLPFFLFKIGISHCDGQLIVPGRESRFH